MGTECITHNGYYITPRGNLHILMLFVTFNDYNAPDNFGIGWAAGDSLPEWTAGKENFVLNSIADSIGNKKNLSGWFNTMSDNEFTVTGDVYAVKINRILYAGDTSYNFMQMNREALRQLVIQHPDIICQSTTSAEIKI